MRQRGVERAADAFCDAQGCSRRSFSTDWTFLLPLPLEATVLELGAGFGDDTLTLSREAARVVGVAPDALAGGILAQRMQAGGRTNVDVVVLRDLSRLPLAAGSVGAIAIEYAAFGGFALTSDRLVTAAAEWRRVLAPGGSLFVGLPGGGQRWLTRLRLREALLGEGHTESINRRVKRLSAPGSEAAPGAAATLRRLRHAGFGRPRIYAPLPDEERIALVVDVEDHRLVRYCLDQMLRRNSLPRRLGLAGAATAARMNLLRHLIPFRFVIFTPERAGARD